MIMKKLLLKFLPGILVTLSILSFSQVLASSTDMDPSFNTKIPLGFNLPVESMSMQNDGKLFVYGNYWIYQ
jgi:hypothetical protein